MIEKIHEAVHNCFVLLVRISIVVLAELVPEQMPNSLSLNSPQQFDNILRSLSDSSF